MRDPFERVPKKLPKIYFNDGTTSSAVWFDPQVGTAKGRARLVRAVKSASEAFFGEYLPQGGEGAMSAPKRLEDLTPEEREGVDALVKAWIEEFVGVTVDERGRKMFRLIPGGRERSAL